jgi:hypothetical protein
LDYRGNRGEGVAVWQGGVVKSWQMSGRVRV